MSLQPYQLTTMAIPGWPKLGWVALMERGSDSVQVLHGRCVETTPDWCVEAVWAGKYAAGDFDRTDLIAGSGVRLRGDTVVFASPADMLNRLYYYEKNDALYVSNSFALLLATANITLLPDYNYSLAMQTIDRGLNDYQREVPTSNGPVRIACFRNLVVSRTGIEEQRKPSSAPDFNDFTSYWQYLVVTARLFGDNAGSPERSHRITPMATVSKGYDSPAAAVLAREAGAREGVTITNARRMADQLIDIDDSGKAVGEQLGLRMRRYSRFRRNYPYEDASWASDGNIGDIYLSVFDYAEPLSLLFTGFFGDVIWGMTPRSGLLRHRGTSGARFSECRLDLGVFNCAPAGWGGRKQREIFRLSHRPEMAPWTLGTSYDRPIPRRIIEEAGGKRGSFATEKKVASFNRRYGRPLSENLRADFAEFMRSQGKRARSGTAERASLLLKGLDSRVFRKLPKPIRFSAREWIEMPEPSMFFLWANDRRSKAYRAALNQITWQPAQSRSEPRFERVAAF